MTEHESNLYDLYAGLAMQGLIARESTGAFNFETCHNDPWRVALWAYDVADQMLRVRKERVDAVEKTQATRNVSDMAVPEMEGREDSDTQGIAALKKTARARHKPT